MNALANIKSRLPDWAKDIRLNLDATIARSSLEPRLAVGAARASAAAFTVAAMRPTSRICWVVNPESFSSFACDWTQNSHLPTIDAASA